MVSIRSRAPALPQPPPQTPPPPPQPPLSTPPASSHYEKCREERIRENRERFQKLGLLELSHQLHSSASVTNRSRKRTAAVDRPSLPPRRSSRLQSVSPVCYTEVDVKKGEGLVNKVSFEIKGEEVYTDEHEKLLGGCETSWTLFDGCGKDGKRIYDQINGKTCHQCRQKTLGHRTSCSRCQIVQGQFCGDCLFMRYGENVLEVNKNPNWICPVCRGICNCSICRIKRGWAPTGSLYRKVTCLGYKSVAHYLIQTRKMQADLGDCGSVEPVGAKKSLIFTEAETLTESEGANSNSNEKRDDSSAEKSGLGKLEENYVKDVSLGDCSSIGPVSAKKSLIFTEAETHTELEGINSNSIENSEKSGFGKSNENCAKSVVNTCMRITRNMSKVMGTES